MTTARIRRERMDALAGLVEQQHGVLLRRQLTARGWTHAAVEAQLNAGRWRPGGYVTIVTYTGPLTQPSCWWRAVLETGPTAVVAGVTALQAAGLLGIDEPDVHVAAPKSSRPRRLDGVVVHETRRIRPDDAVPTGLPRLRVAAAAAMAALWARSDRQAALFLVAPVQQRLVTPEELAAWVARIRRHRRRRLLTAVVADLVTGAHSLGELDFAGVCRGGGLPEPTRQRVVHRPGGRYYLDAEWEPWRVAVEIDGAAHREATTWIDDAWRQNDVVASGRVVLRFPQVAVRVDPARVVAQVRAVLLRRGWRPRRPTIAHL